MSDTSESSRAMSRHLGDEAEANHRFSEECASENEVVCARTIAPDAAEEEGDLVSLKLSTLMLPGDSSDASRGLRLGEDADGGIGGSVSGSPHTPALSVLDQLTAGGCNAEWASLSKKLSDHLNRCVEFLNFCCPVTDSDGSGMQATDEEIIDSIYRDLLEAILIQHIDEILNYISGSGMDFGSCLTPTAPPPLNGISNPCPDAPIKSPPKSRRIVSWDLVKKLDF